MLIITTTTKIVSYVSVYAVNNTEKKKQRINLNNDQENNFIPKRIPKILERKIRSTAEISAKIFKRKDHQEDLLESLILHRTDGTFPKHLELKSIIQQEFSAETLLSIHAQILNENITRVQETIQDKETKIQENYRNLTDLLNTIRWKVTNTITEQECHELYTQHYDEFIITYTIKEEHDKTAKIKKQEAFQAKQDKDAEVITITHKDLTKLTKNITAMHKKIESTNKKALKVKGTQRRKTLGSKNNKTKSKAPKVNTNKPKNNKPKPTNKQTKQKGRKAKAKSKK